jgi:hypothetical protein
LLLATLASPSSNWFAQRWVFKLLYTAQQQKDRLPNGLLPEPSTKAREAVEERGFRLKRGGIEWITASVIWLIMLICARVFAIVVPGGGVYSSYTFDYREMPE